MTDAELDVSAISGQLAGVEYAADVYSVPLSISGSESDKGPKINAKSMSFEWVQFMLYGRQEFFVVLSRYPPPTCADHEIRTGIICQFSKSHQALSFNFALHPR